VEGVTGDLVTRALLEMYLPLLNGMLRFKFRAHCQIELICERLLFVATSIMALLHVMNTRNSNSTKHDPTIEVNHGGHQPYPAV
jgi:hypothetical protein